MDKSLTIMLQQRMKYILRKVGKPQKFGKKPGMFITEIKFWTNKNKIN